MCSPVERFESNTYRAEQGITGTWQARERVVVALTGGPEGETLLRRGARIAARSAGGELLAVHVTTQDGLRNETPGALAAQRTLVEQLGGKATPAVGFGMGLERVIAWITGIDHIREAIPFPRMLSRMRP